MEKQIQKMLEEECDEVDRVIISEYHEMVKWVKSLFTDDKNVVKIPFKKWSKERPLPYTEFNPFTGKKIASREECEFIHPIAIIWRELGDYESENSEVDEEPENNISELKILKGQLLYTYSRPFGHFKNAKYYFYKKDVLN